MAKCGDTVLHLFVAENGSLGYRKEQVWCAESHVAEAVFIALAAVSAAALNFLLFLVLITDRQMRRRYLPLLVISLTSCQVLESLLCGIMSAAYAGWQLWPFSSAGCRLHGMLSEWLPAVSSCLILQTTLERMHYLKWIICFDKFHAAVLCNKRFFLCLSWLGPLLLTGMLLSGQLNVSPHRGLYSCLVRDPDGRFFHGLPLLLIHFAALASFIVCIFYVVSTVVSKHGTVSKRTTKHSLVYTSKTFVTPLFQKEKDLTLVIAITVILFMVLSLPKNLFVHFNQVLAVYEERNITANGTNWTGEGQTSVNGTNSMQDNPSGGWHEPFLMWLKYLYLIFQPGVVLFLDRKIRAMTVALFRSYPSSFVASKPKIRPLSAALNRDGFKKALTGSQSLTTSYKTPVLFSTAEGLYLRLYNAKQCESKLRLFRFNANSSKETSSNFSLYMCDLFQASNRMKENSDNEEKFPNTVELAPPENNASIPKNIDNISQLSNDKNILSKKSVRFATNHQDQPQYAQSKKSSTTSSSGSSLRSILSRKKLPKTNSMTRKGVSTRNPRNISQLN